MLFQFGHSSALQYSTVSSLFRTGAHLGFILVFVCIFIFIINLFVHFLLSYFLLFSIGFIFIIIVIVVVFIFLLLLVIIVCHASASVFEPTLHCAVDAKLCGETSSEAKSIYSRASIAFVERVRLFFLPIFLFNVLLPVVFQTFAPAPSHSFCVLLFSTCFIFVFACMCLLSI